MEGNSSWPAVISTKIETCKVGSYTDYEGTRFSGISGSLRTVSSSNVITVGKVANAQVFGPAVGETTGILQLTFSTPVNRYPLNLGETVQTFKISNNNIVPIFSTTNTGIQPISIEGNYIINYVITETVFDQMTFDPTGFALEFGLEVQDLIGRMIVHRSDSIGYGDNPRDKYAIVSLYNASPQEAELFSINLEVSESNLDSSS